MNKHLVRYAVRKTVSCIIALPVLLILFVVFSSYLNATPTTITIVNPNASAVTIRTSTGDLDGGNVVTNDWLVSASSTRVVTHVDDGDWVGFSISVSQVIANAQGIMSSTPSSTTQMTFLRGTGEGRINLPNGTIGTAFTVTAKPGPSTLWNEYGISGTSYQYNTSDSDPGGLKSAVTQELFREGVEKIVGAVSAAPSGGGGTGGSVDYTALAAGNPSTGTQSAAGAAKSTELVTSLGNASATSKGYSVDGGSSVPSVFSITIPHMMGGATFDMNPFRDDRLGPIAVWFRGALQWLSVTLLGGWVWKQFSEWLKAFNMTQQAKGNPIAAGTGAQATAFAAAGIISAIVLAAVAALVGFSFDSISLSSLIGGVTTNPLTGMASASLWMLDKCIPVGTLLTCFTAKIAFERFAAGIFAAASTAIRFVVP